MIREIKKDIFFVGAMDYERRLFDELIPLPDGTSYNSYIIKGSEKVALIDTVDPTKEGELLKNLEELNLEKIDYIVSNHAEQDHSGAIPKILELYPEAKVVTNGKCMEFLIDLLIIPKDKFLVISDGDELSLGSNSKTLKFIIAPWVHWPETMFSYLKEDKILFSCDFFGSHLATKELSAKNNKELYESAKRYYAEILMPFRNVIKKHIEKLENIDIEIIAPSHGPVYNKPEFILNNYKDWISDEVKPEVVVAYTSMHGSTEKMAFYLADFLSKKNVVVKIFNLAKTDIGELAMALVDASTLILASPTFLSGPHPNAFYTAYLANAIRPKLKSIAVIGSYGWGGRMLEVLTGILTNIKPEVLTPVIIKGHPKEQDFKLLDELADEIFKRNS